jgi:hypothetical protein
MKIMTQKIKIGSLLHSKNHPYRNEIDKHLIDNGLETSWTDEYNSEKDLEADLLNETIDIMMAPLTTFPPRENIWVYGALSPVLDSREWLVIKPESLDHKRDFRLKENAILSEGNLLRRSQINYYRPDITVRDQSISEGFIDGYFFNLEDIFLKDSNVSFPLGKLSAAHDIEKTIDEYFDSISLYALPLNPQEFVPKIGSGTMALSVLPLSPLRKKLAKIHSENTSNTNNISRRVQKWMETNMPERNDYGVMCRLDNQGFFHATVFSGVNNPPFSVESSSTSFEFDRAICSKIK